MRRTSARGRAGLVLIALGACCLAALHVAHALRTDLEPWRHRLSEYANGPFGVLMMVTFASLGAALLLLATVAAPRRRITRAGMRIAGCGLLVAGVFRTGVTEAGATSDALHGIGSSVATVGMTAVAATSRAWVLAAPAMALLVASPFTHGTVIAGSNQRLLWATLLIWAVAAARSMDVSDPSARAPTMRS